MVLRSHCQVIKTMLPSCQIKETVSTYSCWLAVEEAWVPRAGSAGTPHRNRHGGGWPRRSAKWQRGRCGANWEKLAAGAPSTVLLANIGSSDKHITSLPSGARAIIAWWGRARESSGELGKAVIACRHVAYVASTRSSLQC